MSRGPVYGGQETANCFVAAWLAVCLGFGLLGLFLHFLKV